MSSPGNVSLTETAYKHVKKRILSLELAPDSLVDEASIARDLGVSKTPVRQALNRLAQEGFVRVLAQRGTLVARSSLSDIQQVYLLRQLLEPEVSRLAALRATGDQITHLMRLDQEFERSDELEPDLDKHTEFHVAVAATAGVPRLTRIVTELQEQMQWFMAVRAAAGGILPARHHHQELVNAIEAGDGEAARQITEQSLRQSRENIVREIVATSGSFLPEQPGAELIGQSLGRVLDQLPERRGLRSKSSVENKTSHLRIGQQREAQLPR